MEPYRLINTPVRPAARLSALQIRIGGVVPCGYPAEAYNYIEPELDLNKKIIRNKRHTLCVWATNSRMTGEGIAFSDMIVVDESVRWKPDSIGLYWLDDEFMLCREVREPDGLRLVSINPTVKDIWVEEGERLERRGIVTFAVKKYSVYHNNYASLPENIETLVDKGMDFSRYLIPEGHEHLTFYLWACGESMEGDGIESGDLLIVDNTAPLHEDSIQVFTIDGRFTLKRAVIRDDYCELVSSNPRTPPVRIRKGEEMQRWSILTGVVKCFYGKQHDKIPSF